MENNQKQPFMEFPSVESRVIAGILFFAGTLIILGWAAINEPARMEEFTERFDGRSVETGAILFENNCATCHGADGYGQAGRAPALNNPFLFGYDFFEEHDRQIAILQGEIEAVDPEEEPEKVAELEAELALVEAQRQEVYETLRYDYSAQWAELDAQLTTLDARIKEETGMPPTLVNSRVTDLTGQIDTLRLEETPILERIAAAEAAGESSDPLDIQRRDEIQAEIATLEAELTPLSALATERQPVFDKTNRYRALNDAHQQVVSLRQQIAELQSQLAALAEGDTTRTEIEAQLDTLESELSAQEDARDTALEAMVTAGDIVDFDPEANSRLTQLRWNGTLEDLIYTTLVSGRPVSASYWPEPMAAWSQDAGGPLRRDQIQNLTDYVLNWDREFTVADVRRIQQLAIEPSASGEAAAEGVCPDAANDPDSCDIEDIVAQLDALTLDPNQGQADYGAGGYGCTSCHFSGSNQAPAPQGVYTRAVEHATNNPDLFPSARYYLVQSVLLPGAFTAPGFEAFAQLMPRTFGRQLDIQTLGNIVAYLESQDQ
jgi:mono/diheme cytochrome c family protein